MIEAALRWLEFVAYADGRLSVEAPRPQNPLEDLSIHIVRLHVAGVIRALARALDCMAGTIIGVLALPRPILKADFGRVRELLKNIVARGC